MNQIVISSQTMSILESVKSILLTACSDPAFTATKNGPSQKQLLEKLGFSALGDRRDSASASDNVKDAKLASELMELIIS
jgi:hypothetical protein